MTDKERDMEHAFQGIIDSTEELMEAIGKMDWERIETLGTEIAALAMILKALSKVN